MLPPTEPSDANLAILVVDDDPRNLIAVQSALAPDGHDIVLADSGLSALRHLLVRDFAVIVLDVRMPDVDGFDTARLIRGRPRSAHTPIIFVTANTHDAEWVREGYALGAVDVMFKPLVAEVLRAKVSVFVELERRAARLRTLERRRWEAESLRVENERKDQFLAVLGHELRNPLTPIVHSLRLLRDRPDDPALLQGSLDAMERQVHQLTRLVDDLLDLGRIAAGKITIRPGPTDLWAVVTQALEATADLIREKGHRVETTPPAEPIVLVADPDRLAQVFTNLVSNAARYTDPAGTLSVGVGMDPGSVWVRVTDTGHGLHPDAIPHLFDPFFQVGGSGSGPGLGLGLAVVQHIVELHGGAVTASSEGLGSGSTFEVRLPHHVARLAPLAAAPTEPSADDRVLEILLVDDNADVSEITGALLRSYGHSVTLAAGGGEALEAVRHHVPNLILMDLGMPDLDGHETARRLKDQLQSATPPMVALSGYAAPTGDDPLFVAHLVKPVDPDVLLRTIQVVSTRM